MTLYTVIFYLLAALILASTGFAVTRRNLVHAVIFLVISFFASAMLFYLLGAPLLAALEVIIYAGAIMVLFLFIIMMLDMDRYREPMGDRRQLIPAVVLSALCAGIGLMLGGVPGGDTPMTAAVAASSVLGYHVFSVHWLSIEIASLLLLVALIGALHMARPPREDPDESDTGATR